MDGRGGGWKGGGGGGGGRGRVGQGGRVRRAKVIIHDIFNPRRTCARGLR